MSARLPRADPNAPLTGAVKHIDSPRLTAVMWTCFSIATCFMALRLGVRWRQNRTFLADDCWMTWAWLCLSTMVILQTEQIPLLYYITYLMAGRIDVTADSPDRAMQYQRCQVAIVGLFWTVLWSVKASFLSIFHRLLWPFPLHRRAWYCVVVFAFLSYVGCLVGLALAWCSPPPDYSSLLGKCNSEHELRRTVLVVSFSTSVDLATDVAIMALPITLLPSLQLNCKKKVGLGVIFSLAALIICAAIVRLTQVVVNVNYAVDLIGLCLWGIVEASTAILVGSLLPLKAFLTRGVKQYVFNVKSSLQIRQTVRRDQRGENSQGLDSPTVVVADFIPLDDVHRSYQLDGGICVQNTFETHIEHNNLSRDNDVAL